MVTELSWPVRGWRQMYSSKDEIQVLTSECENITRGREANGVNPTARGTGIFATNGVEREFLSPDSCSRANVTAFSASPHKRMSITHRLSTSLMYAEKTRAFISAPPAARRTLFGCQSTDKIVDLMGFLRSRDTHQSPSGSNEQIAIALKRIPSEPRRPR